MLKSRASLLCCTVLLLVSTASAGTWYSDPNGELAKASATVAKAQVKHAQVTSQQRQHITSYSMVYNISGDWSPSDQKIANHLRRDHGINPNGMTRVEMLMAHDTAHGVHVRAPRQTVAATSSCPGGVCPTGKASRRGSRR